MLKEVSRKLSAAEKRLIRTRAKSVRSNIISGIYPDSIALHMTDFAGRLEVEAQTGRAYSILCKPTRIITRTEIEDEGASWIFDGGDGNYLGLFGQDFWETPRFPSSFFEIISGATFRTIIAMRSLADTHPPLSYISVPEEAWKPIWKSDLWRSSDPVWIEAEPEIDPVELVRTAHTCIRK